MYSEMWEDHTEDIFEEITEAEALSDSIYKMYPSFPGRLIDNGYCKRYNC